jgi:uncharacterized protein involved in response to NO
MPEQTNIPAVFQTGFRLFFLGAMLFSIVSMLQWTWQLYYHEQIALQTISRTQWHGHEMLFGYAGAVIAGFLLTAVQNWTGRTTANDKPLLILFLFWLGARVFATLPQQDSLYYVLLFSNLFYAALLLAIFRPIVQTGNNAQWGIGAKLLLLWVLDDLFLCSAIGWLDSQYASTYLLIAVYTVIGLILVMAQRVMPFFTRNTIEDKNNVRDYPYVSLISLLSLLGLLVADIMSWHNAMLACGMVFAASNIIRLYGWYDAEIWHKPLLWVLYVALVFIIAGVIMRVTSHLTATLPSLGLHAMTYGGIGVITIGMMARVSLGHTGRNVFEPPSGLAVPFIMLIAGAVIRALLPLVMMDYYFLLILVSQIFWIGAFLLMLVFFLVPLLQPRPDGKFG